MFKRLFYLGSLACLAAGCVGPHSDSPRRERPYRPVGRIEGSSYYSPSGHFSVQFPVSPEEDGRVVYDDSQSVTFRDKVGSRISFSSRSINPKSPMMATLKKGGATKALAILVKDIYGDQVVIQEHPEILNGAVAFIYLRPIGPKTGVAGFVQGERVYLVDTDLVPGVSELSRKDAETQKDLDDWLEKRALTLLQTMDIH